MSNHRIKKDCITITGACQNNLKNLDLSIPLNQLVVVTGVSGSGKSSLAFDTIYAEGQRRYVETFSPYARQFLDRMDKPNAERIDGIPPSIAIDQTNPVRTSRSTVGTMTELNDHLKLLFARTTRLFCRGCGAEVRRDSAQSILNDLLRKSTNGERALITFTVDIPHNFSAKEIEQFLAQQGYVHIHQKSKSQLEIVQDRLRIVPKNRDRIIEALEAGLKQGHGHISIHVLNEQNEPAQTWKYSSHLHCAQCDIHYQETTPNTFSFNSPLGACESCRGFGRVIGVDDALVVPDGHKTLAEGAVKPWQTESYIECQGDLMKFAKLRGIPTDVPWQQLNKSQQQWVLQGEGSWEDGLWYGVKRFFAWLETKSYKMHIRVLLSKYRSYTPCPDCDGARLKPDALLWQLGSAEEAAEVVAPEQRFQHPGNPLSTEIYHSLPGLNIHDVMLLPIERCQRFFNGLHLPQPLDEATDLLLSEIRSRLSYLNEVGLGYLTLDRQSRTLSGGEVQRINLTTALGTSLVNTLFVLDEPSIGLHPRDIKNIIKVMHKLRDSGNSLIVVEHDPQIMFTADRILDMGPGPGEHGGQAVFFGSPRQLLASRRSVTAKYLSGKKTVAKELTKTSAAESGDTGRAFLRITGAAEHNLKNIDVNIPLRQMVCVTGVSGSGKSTLIQDICYHALRKLKGKPVEMPGKHHSISGHEFLCDVVLVDQSPIGKTTRSNPASYVGALDGIRKAFAAEPLAVERNYTAGTFSFNSGHGRCPTCSGNGFELVEMQFLSDVYIRCPDCNGKRYRSEVLEVKLLPAHYQGSAKSMADLLDLTVTEAIEFFHDNPAILAALQPLQDVGLSYLKLGQPVPTLSGGEAQRLKLAGHLVKSGTNEQHSGNLFLFDEPTTGLHFEDISKLLRAFRQLIEQGHSLVIIEHNLDVICASDWIIDLGPEGGEQGGQIVCQGTPKQIQSHKTSHTAAAIRDYKKTLARFARSVQKKPASRAPKKALVKPAVEIHKAREHNLQNVDINIPREKFTVITGVSGSGKSTVAFDILFAEGQRRYLESLNAYARQFVQPSSRPDVDAVFGIPPTVAIEQRTSRGGRKSTVATMTEIYHFLRLLFVKLGTQYCPDCDIAIEPQSAQAIVAKIMRTYRNKNITLLAPLVVSRKGYYTDLAKWAAKKGFVQLRVDGQLLETGQWPRLDRFKEHNIDLPVSSLTVSPKREADLYAAILRALDFGKGVIHVVLTSKLETASAKQEIYSSKRACPGCGRSFEELDPRLFSYNSKHGWCESCLGTGVELQDFDETQTGEEWWWQESEQSDKTCPSCQGQRLRPEALAVRFKNQSIAKFNALPVAKALKTFSAVKLNQRETDIAHSVIQEILSRLRFLQEVGLSYLSLDRSAPTLSGGEAQRIRLAAQLGSNLRGVCYILDEPTIGLHPRDNTMLLNTLAKLEGKGNTIVVVEHDEDTIRRAEHIIDLGPGAGVNGGRLVAQGSIKTVMRSKQSLTGQFLAKPLHHPLLQRRYTQITGKVKSLCLEIQKARLNNLKNIDAKIPLQRLVCVTGVSGSGKSTLIRQVLHENLKPLLTTPKRKSGKTKPLQGCDNISGTETIGRLLEVDQTPIGKTPRSCPATYIGFWDQIRRLFAETPEARMRGYTASRFSFNVAGGRCDGCEGQGYKKIEMSFLPDVKVPCDVCNGARFNQETLSILYKGKNIGEVLAMSVEEATEFFSALPNIHKALQLLQDVGLGYLTLGQQSPTLSGGEAQRIKLVSELAKAVTQQPPPDMPSKKSKAARAIRHTLYILDEPTIGLHMADVEKLIRVLHRLVDAGNSVIVIEHNLDVIAEADWIIDLGPEGGELGGRVVAQGTPETVVQVKQRSQTAKSLREFLSNRSR